MAAWTILYYHSKKSQASLLSYLKGTSYHQEHLLITHNFVTLMWNKYDFSFMVLITYNFLGNVLLKLSCFPFMEWVQ